MQKRKGGRYPLNQSPFFKLLTKRKLARILGIDLQALRTYRDTDRFYKECEIPKKNGGIRLIENPRRHLKLIQARIAKLLGRINPPDYLFCPVKGRSYVTNAAHHAGHRVVRSLDIKKYFPSTTRNRVYLFFKNVMRCSSDVAEILATIATYKGHLPTGSPLSPIMAFYAHFDVWESVHRTVTSAGATNSLYIDDLTVSGAKVPEKLNWEIKKIIFRSGLRYHKEKLFRDRPSEITGVIIRDGQLVPPNRQLAKRSKTEQALRSVMQSSEKEKLSATLKGIQGQLDQIRTANFNLQKQ